MSTELSKTFSELTGLPYPKSNGKDYIHPQAYSLTDIGVSLTQSEFDNVAVQVANTIDTTAQAIQKLDKGTLSELGYPIETIDVMKVTTSDLCYMRLGFVVDVAGNLKCIEVNSQTPSFNYELEEGTDVLLRLLKQPPRKLHYLQNLQASLRHNLLQVAKNLNKPLENCRVGLLTCNESEDIYQMQYLKRIIDGLNVCESEVLTGSTVDFKKQSKTMFNTQTGNVIDIVLNWYPLEWSCNENFADGTAFKDCLLEAIQTKKLAVFNGLSFTAQNKYLLAYLTETIDPGKYLTPSYYTQEALLQALPNTDWIGKPIFGRQGAGIFGQRADVQGKARYLNGDLSDSYYTDQYCVYQPLYQTFPLIGKEIYSFTVEKFVYKTEKGWVAGGQGLRLDTKDIIDNSSSWAVLTP